MTDDYALGLFLSNLKPEILADVQMFYPKNLTHAFNLAKKVEAKLLSSLKKNLLPLTGAQLSISLQTRLQIISNKWPKHLQPINQHKTLLYQTFRLELRERKEEKKDCACGVVSLL